MVTARAGHKCGLSLNTITRIEQGISGDLRFSTVEAIGKGFKNQ